MNLQLNLRALKTKCEFINLPLCTGTLGKTFVEPDNVIDKYNIGDIALTKNY